MCDEPRKPGTLRLKDLLSPNEREQIRNEIRSDPTISDQVKAAMENFWIECDKHLPTRKDGA